MPFPRSLREIYSANPLDQVICQLRYPDILTISTSSPAQFQDLIRSLYPLYEAQKPTIVQPPPGVPKEVADLFSAVPLPPIPQLSEHHFLAESRTRQISLTQNFIAVSELQYSRWEKFREEIKLAEQVLRETYFPAFYNRVGLRYIDVLDKSKLGLADTPWSELFNSSFIGMLGDSNIADDLQELQVATLLTISDVVNGKVRLRHGLKKSEPDGEQVYIIDADFYTDQRSDSDAAFNALDKFNKWGGDLFRWAISDKLRSALEPTRI